ncbi:MAG TPA: hypothetical protein VGC99_05395 [Candidatus Tectomicrobia bacterium]|jgi:hypothetical protein
MQTGEGQSWMEDCQRIVEEFNEVAVPAFRQEYGADEALLTIAMSLQPAQEDIQLDVGTRAVFLVESITGLVFKIGSNGRLREDKCIGHITGITGRELYRWLWW